MSSDEELGARINKTVFPGIQGGPLMHQVAAKAVCFYEASQPEFKEYARQVRSNADALSSALEAEGFRIVSGGTDCHLLLMDVRPFGLTGKSAEKVLDAVGITTNKNTIPYDPEKPFVTSGLRVGTPAVTTRGMKEPEMQTIASLIGQAIRSHGDEPALVEIQARVRDLTGRFPVHDVG